MEALENAALAFVDRARQHATMLELLADFTATLDQLGFNHFIMTRLPAINEDPEPLIIAHTWPEEWGDRYRAQRYFWADPVTRWSFEAYRPFTWGEARQGSPETPIALQLADEARALGLVDGLGFPMGDPKAAQGVVSLSSDHAIDLTPRVRALAEVVIIQCERRALELVERPLPAVPMLSPREREILQWLLVGKGRNEVATILGTSDRTVESQLRTIREKTSASTNTQAIAKALFTRQIHL